MIPRFSTPYGTTYANPDRAKLYRTFGWTNDKIPADFQGIILFEGAPLIVRKGQPGRKHRIFFICECGRFIPTGRLHQHTCTRRDHGRG